jgi:hypothetical protein
LGPHGCKGSGGMATAWPRLSRRRACSGCAGFVDLALVLEAVVALAVCFGSPGHGPSSPETPLTAPGKKPLQLGRVHLLELLPRRGRPVLHPLSRHPESLVQPRDQCLRRLQVTAAPDWQSTYRLLHVRRFSDERLGYHRPRSQLLERERPCRGPARARRFRGGAPAPRARGWPDTANATDRDTYKKGAKAGRSARAI